MPKVCRRSWAPTPARQRLPGRSLGGIARHRFAFVLVPPERVAKTNAPRAGELALLGRAPPSPASVSGISRRASFVLPPSQCEAAGAVHPPDIRLFDRAGELDLLIGRDGRVGAEQEKREHPPRCGYLRDPRRCSVQTGPPTRWQPDERHSRRRGLGTRDVRVPRLLTLKPFFSSCSLKLEAMQSASVPSATWENTFSAAAAVS